MTNHKIHSPHPIAHASTSIVSLMILAVLAVVSGATEPSTAEQLDFFESRIRPVLIEHCYPCHNSAESAEGGLAIDHRDGLLAGGDRGAVLVPGNPDQSRLLAVLRHEIDGLEMPEGGGKLDDRVIADFAKWIAAGAADPRDQPPSSAELLAATSWEATLDRRKAWWSFQPIRRAHVPGLIGGSSHPIDRFIERKISETGLQSAPPADAATLVRRLYFNLIGLPPTPAEANHWVSRIGVADQAGRQTVVGELVDGLLDRPQFGERWARHWMDWIRYAESHGSEGDPAIDNAWMYRDYLIRALNADVPYDQLVREHIAGDLLEHPRENHELGINESIIGPAQLRMVFHGFAPTDALDEKVRFVDDQINTLSKAFLGLTVSCARCHDHKFDAISQKDYYAMFGVLGSCRPARSVIELPERQNLHRDALANLKPKIRAAIAKDWLSQSGRLTALLSINGIAGTENEGIWKEAEKPHSMLYPLYRLNVEISAGKSFDVAWEIQNRSWKEGQNQTIDPVAFWNLSDPHDYADWFPKGIGLPKQPQAPGEFSVAAEGDLAVTGIYPAGVYSHTISQKYPARLTSPDLIVGQDQELWVRTIGDRGAGLRYVVQHYPRNGTVYPVTELKNHWQWQRYDLTYWNGDSLHIELSAGQDAPLLVKNEPRSWFGIREAMVTAKGEPAPGDPTEHLGLLFEAAEASPPESICDVAQLYQHVIESAIGAWRSGSVTDAQAVLLDESLRLGLLENHLERLPAAGPLIAQYRKLENEIPVPRRVPGVDETVARDQPLFVRGNHKLPDADVPRRFLEAIDATPYDTELSGRRQLAENLLRDDNPLSRRVIVNRVWHHLFGRGIVATPDNFGRMGNEPTHPELLDYLATRFVDDGWSLKKLIRLIVSSETWQRDSRASSAATELDPDNRLLARTNVRRLEAEAIRDSLLAVSGQLDEQISGPPVDGDSPRRSVYVRVIRNSLDPFLQAFDFPEPFSATGRRDITNVPAQSLTMMNDVRTDRYAAAWARRVLNDGTLMTDESRIRSMFLAAFGRDAATSEVSRAIDYLAETRQHAIDVQHSLASLRQQVDDRRERVGQMIDPIRTRLLQQAEKGSETAKQQAPQPIGRWEFEQGLDDLVGSAGGEFRDGAHLSGGALIVRDVGHVVTAPISISVKEKTLEAWVRLDNLSQRGGGVITIQTPNGVIFDSIVFGEKDPAQWMAGSNGFSRTQSFGGPKESDAIDRPVHVAIAYHADGRISGYRNGKAYGSPYKSNGPQPFKAGEAVISFGVRHLPAGGNRMLSGSILKAQLYDRALSAKEIAVTSGQSNAFISDAKLIAELTETERQQLETLRDKIAELESTIESFGKIPDADDQAVWSDLARAMLTFKEFIYVK